MTRKVGTWIVGAHGNVGTLVAAGAASIARGLQDETGLVTATPEFEGLDLTPVEGLVFGGHDIRLGCLVDGAREFHERNGLLSARLRDAITPELRRTSAEIRPGILLNPDPMVGEMASPSVRQQGSPKEMIAQVQSDLRSFRDRHKLDGMVVVNLCSTEPRLGHNAALESRDAFLAALDSGATDGIPASVIYAFAAVDAGLPFVDFTPSIAAGVGAVRETAELRGVPHMGRDGKTGETLVKTVLAPMFVQRHLPVTAWYGVNMLGNRDGQILRAPGAKASKVHDKDEALRRILPNDDVHSRVRIDYVPSLEDWKQAYDFVHFRGFMGAQMQMHFLWQGCDSALAAPLVLDLVRLADLAHRRGETGTMPHLACFFKSPIDVEEQGFAKQMRSLYAYVAGARETAAG